MNRLGWFFLFVGLAGAAGAQTVADARAWLPRWSDLDPNLRGEITVSLPWTAPADPLDRLARAAAGVASLKGLPVYSESLGRMETFLLDSYRIAQRGSKVAVADPPVDALPAVVLVHQVEEQAGDVESKLTIEKVGGGLLVTQTNLTPIRLWGLPFIDPGKLRTAVLLIPQKDHVDLVGVTEADTTRFFGLEKFKQTSLTHRLEALARWYVQRLRL